MRLDGNFATRVGHGSCDRVVGRIRIEGRDVGLSP